MCDQHRICANGIVNMMEKFYYKPLETKRELSIQKMLSQSNLKHTFVFKPEYFNYLLFYQIYMISHHWSHHNVIPLHLHIHSFYITYLTQTEIEERYQYQSPFDTTFIKEIALYLYQSLLFYKVKNTPKDSFSSFVYISLLSFFMLLMNYHESHQERLKDIQKRSSSHSIRKLLITTPNKIVLKKIVHYTRYFTFSNFLFFLSSLLYLIL